MMKRMSLLLGILCLFSCFAGCAPSGNVAEQYTGPQKVLVTDQLHRALKIYDLRKEDWSEPDWVWTSDARTFTNVDGAKYRFDPISKMDVIAFCSSGGYAGIVSYPVGEILSYITNAGHNPHSVEILPDGALVVASSTGNSVRIYERTQYGDAELTEYTEVEVPSAHGVLWDPDDEILWALGMGRLYAYEVTEEHKMILLEDRSVNLPSAGGHDLQPVYGTKDLFWITSGYNVIQFNKTTGEMSIRYPGWGTVSALANVKGIGNFEDGTLVLAQQNGVWLEHNTNVVTVGIYNEKSGVYDLTPREIPGVAYYKLRVFEKDYR